MITAEAAWVRVERAYALLATWETRYNELYEATVVNHIRVARSRGEILTRAQAEAQVDVLTDSTHFSKLRVAEKNYLRYLNEVRAWIDVWRAACDSASS